MKTTAKLYILALTISLASCSKSNDDNPSNTNNTGQVTGNWKVTYYFDSGKDETSDYNGYTFNFNTGNILEAVTGSATYTGTWTLGEPGDDDNSSNKFVITITGNKAMDDLTDDWKILKMTDTEIWLQDDNLTSAEELRFGKL
jgi:hypothetical protein